MIAVFALLVAPSTVFGTVWMLTSGFDFAQTSTFELVAAVAVLPIGLLMTWIGIRELAGGVGVTIDDEGVKKGGTQIRWDEVEELAAPEFGLLDLKAGSKQLRLRTYLFRNRVELLEFVAEKTGRPAPEMGRSL